MLGVGRNASSAQAANALIDLNDMLEGLVGAGASFPMTTIIVDSAYTMTDDQRAVRFLCLTGLTITLPENPVDGAIVEIKDVKGTAASSNIVLSANGNWIESASSVTILTASLQRKWRFRADTGNWTRLATLGLDDSLPFPDEFDTVLALLLARRLEGEYGANLSGSDQALAKAGKTRLRARYVKPPEAGFDGALGNVGGATNVYWGLSSIDDV